MFKAGKEIAKNSLQIPQNLLAIFHPNDTTVNIFQKKNLYI